MCPFVPLLPVFRLFLIAGLRACRKLVLNLKSKAYGLQYCQSSARPDDRAKGRRDWPTLSR